MKDIRKVTQITSGKIKYETAASLRRTCFIPVMDLEYLKLLDEDASDVFMPTLQLAAAAAQTFFLSAAYTLDEACKWVQFRPATMPVFPSTTRPTNGKWPLAIKHGSNQELWSDGEKIVHAAHLDKQKAPLSLIRKQLKDQHGVDRTEKAISVKLVKMRKHARTNSARNCQAFFLRLDKPWRLVNSSFFFEKA